MGSLVITPTDPAYPAALADLARKGALPSLYLRGPLPTLPGVAIVGTRQPTAEALSFTRELVTRLAAEGLAIWSGGALGIDAAAHETALACGAPTVVVMGGGLDRPYPKAHVALYERVLAAGGALLARVPDETDPNPGGFHLRNELLAAITAVTVVIQAGYQSGARSTARAARRLGRPLGVVPHAPWDEAGRGCALELAHGARAITRAADVIAAMTGAPPVRPPEARSRTVSRARSPEPLPLFGPETAGKPPVSSRGLPDPTGGPILPGPDAAPSQRRLEGPELAVFAALGPAAHHLDEICERSGEPPGVVFATLLMLTLRTVVVEGPAGFFRRAGRP
ncbi:MAG: DNA-processing protein DprA [Byssovorax sp.]